MPELPEVQTVVSDLNKKVKGKKITGVWLDWPKMIKDFKKQSRLKVSKSAVEFFKKNLPGKKILKAKRIGKNVLIYLSHDYLLLIHQKMTGHLLVGKWKVKGKKVIPVSPKSVIEDPYNGYIRLILYLSDNSMLALSDLRRFAKVIFGKTKDIENLKELKELGPDALDRNLSFSKFKSLIKRHKRKLKTVLLDPKVIAGIGNIYSDDILWQSKLHANRPAASLKEAELKDLYKAMRLVLKKAVKLRGTSTSDFRDTAGKKGNYTEKRLVYQRTGEPCRRCKKPIIRIKINGRSSHLCPACQKHK